MLMYSAVDSRVRWDDSSSLKRRLDISSHSHELMNSKRAWKVQIHVPSSSIIDELWFMRSRKIFPLHTQLSLMDRSITSVAQVWTLSSMLLLHAETFSNIKFFGIFFTSQIILLALIFKRNEKEFDINKLFNLIERSIPFFLIDFGWISCWFCVDCWSFELQLRKY